MFFIGTQLLSLPKMNESSNILKSQPAMNAIFFISTGTILVDFTKGYILSLKRRQTIKFIEDQRYL
jgi:hypothetical protein